LAFTQSSGYAKRAAVVSLVYFADRQRAYRINPLAEEKFASNTAGTCIEQAHSGFMG
jgi:hypothetical protein